MTKKKPKPRRVGIGTKAPTNLLLYEINAHQSNMEFKMTKTDTHKWHYVYEAEMKGFLAITYDNFTFSTIASTINSGMGT